MADPCKRLLERLGTAFSRCKSQRFSQVLLFLVVLTGAQAQTTSTRRILILNEVGTQHPTIPIIDQHITAVLQNSPYRIEWYKDYLDTMWFPDPGDQQRFRQFIIDKYRNLQPNVIITVGPTPLRFMAEKHKEAFPGIPIVFCLPNADAPGAPELDADFTGVETDLDAAKTLRLALAVRSETKHVFVIGGTSRWDRSQEEVVKAQLKQYEHSVDISYIFDLTMPALLERVRKLPEQSIILFTTIGRDAAGTRFSSAGEASPAITAAANAPVFSLYDIYLNHGEVGGYLSGVADQGTIAGEMTLEILNGRKPQDIPRRKSVITFMFDWRALRRWGIEESALPAGSIVLNRPPNFWQAYRKYIFIALLVLLAQSVAICALLIQRVKRKRAESELAESEERFRLVANTAPVMIWMSGPDKLCTYFNQRWLDFAGRPMEAELGNGWAESVHPDDLDRCMQTYVTAFDRREQFRMEYRLRRHDGEYRWVLGIGVPRLNQYRAFAGYIGSCVDVTERKQADQAIRGMNQALLEQSASLQAREELLKVFVKNVPAAVAMLDRDMRYLQVSDRWCTDYLSGTREEVVGRLHYQTFPDMPERWKEVHRRALEGETLRADEDHWDSQDGRHWARWEVRPWKTSEGTVGGILIFAEDITRRKQMEELVSSMTRRLIEAQEQESARIGRELHDDINQRLAILAIELEQLADKPSKHRTSVMKIRNEVLDISSDVQTLSHELHSAKLEYLGVVAGIKSWCREFGKRTAIEIDFNSDVQTDLPLDVGVPLFRVLQEALHNVVKHSGAKQVEVGLREDGTEIHLVVRDLGRGFDVEAALRRNGLGLTSMQERVRLMNGKIVIESKPMNGTTIRVSVPFRSAHSSQRVATVNAGQVHHPFPE